MKLKLEKKNNQNDDEKTFSNTVSVSFLLTCHRIDDRGLGQALSVLHTNACV